MCSEYKEQITAQPPRVWALRAAIKRFPIHSWHVLGESDYTPRPLVPFTFPQLLYTLHFISRVKHLFKYTPRFNSIAIQVHRRDHAFGIMLNLPLQCRRCPFFDQKILQRQFTPVAPVVPLEILLVR